MNKLGKREYLKLIVEAMTYEYGNTLHEYDTDLKMAKRVLRKLNDYLFFHPHDMNDEEWNKFLKDRKE